MDLLSKISIYGEGSGYFMATVGDDLLKKSTGTLILHLFGKVEMLLKDLVLLMV
jgi:hypothetical protein